MLQQFLFDPERIRTTGRLFPATTEDDTRVAYHGTCSSYAPTIERGGLVPRFPIYDFGEILKIAASLPKEDSALAASLKEYADAGGTRLSLSPVSIKAADYSYQCGGQISAQLRRALPKATYCPSGIVTALQTLEHSAPIVFAVDLQPLLGGRVSNDPGSRNIYADEPIPKELLVAWMELPTPKPAVLAEVNSASPTYRQLRSVRGTLVNTLFEKSLR